MGSSSNVPTIGVRLSAVGVQDVVNALSRVRQEGKKTGVETSASLELINGALEQLKELLPAISFAIAVEKLADIALGARETAEAMGKLSDKTGAAIGTLSVLNLVAHDTEISQDALSSGLIKLAKNQEDASNGSKKQLKAFQDLGISIKDLKNQDPGQMFVSVAQKLDALPDGAHKAQIAIALFGKTGADLIPMLNSLGEDGFGKALEKAKKLGLYLDGDMVNQAAAAQDALHEIGDIANGLGTRFIAGFAPQFTQGVEMIAGALEGHGVDAVEEFGETVGKVFKGIMAYIIAVGAAWTTIFKNAAEEAKFDLGQIAEGFKGLATGGVSGAVANIMGYRAVNGANHQATLDANGAAFKAALKDAWAQFMAAPDRASGKPHGNGGGGASGDGTDPTNDRAAQAKLAYLQSLSDNELAILQLKNQIAAADDKRAYDNGIISLETYYDRRKDRIVAEADKEVEILKQKRDALSKLPDSTPEQSDKKKQALAAIDTQITKTQLQEDAALKAADDDRAKARHDAAIAELGDIQKLKQMSGDRYGAQETALQIELQQYTELLEKQHKSTDEITASVDAYKKRAQAVIDFGRNQQDFSSAMSDLNLGIGNIRNQAANGSISNVEAQAQINDLQRKSLETLAAIGQQLTDNAKLSGNPELIAQAKQLNKSWMDVQVSLTNVTTAQTYLINQVSTRGISALSDFFTAGISGSKSFGDALGDLAATFENIVAKMISELLIFYALQEVLGLVGVKQSTITSIIGTSPFSKGFDDGGYTANIPTNKVAGVVHGQEWVATAAQTAKYRPLFDMIMAGDLDKALQTPTIIPRSAMSKLPLDYADSVTGGPGTARSGTGVRGLDIPAPIINVTNKTGQPSSQKQLVGTNGVSVTEIIIGTVAADIAKGGQVAKSIQSNYGATRQGIRRG
jgi:hypothetical protein